MIFSLLSTIALAGSLDILPSLVGRGESQPITQALPAGDLNGDGLGDLVLGSPYDDTAGHEAGGVYFIYDVGSLSSYVPVHEAGAFLGGEDTGDHAGYSVVVIGDTDLDGYPEVAVGAPEASTENTSIAGKAYILYGHRGPFKGLDGSLGDHPYMSGSEKFTRIGVRIFAIGDVDLDPDARPDIMLGVPYATPNGGVAVGWAGVVYATESDWTPNTPDPLRMNYFLDNQNPKNSEWQVEGADMGFVIEGGATLFGRAATRIPDVDGDAIDDVIIAAPHIDYDDPEAIIGHGAAYIFPMRTAAEQNALPVLDGTQAIGSIVGDAVGDNVAWDLTRMTDGRVALSVTERDLSTGGVYLISELTTLNTHLSDADAGYVGDTINEQVGYDVADATGTGDAILAIGSPGWETFRGRVSFVEEINDERTISKAPAIHLEGCWAGSNTGKTVEAHPGPDPFGLNERWYVVTAPGASVSANEDGITYILTQSDFEAAANTECEKIFDFHFGHDDDGDGYYEGDDCDDTAPSIYPHAPETCGNGIDEDCDGEDTPCVDATTTGCGGCASYSPTNTSLLVLATLIAFVSRRRLIAGVAVLALVPNLASAADVWDVSEDNIAKFWGSTAFGYLRGPAVSGDYNADGFPDIALGNYSGNTEYYVAGKTFVVAYNKISGQVHLNHANVTIIGSEEHDYLGVSLANITPEIPSEPIQLLIGANHLGLTENDQGDAFLFRHPLDLPTTVLAAGVGDNSTDIILKGDDPGDGFGTTIVEGDFDGDGLIDVAIAAPFRDSIETDIDGVPLFKDEGVIWLLHNGRIHDVLSAPVIIKAFASGSIKGVGSKSAPGVRLAVGDINGNGMDDLLVGTMQPDSAWYGGEVHLYSDLVANNIPLYVDEDDGSWVSLDDETYAGQGLSVADTDNDGVDEVAVSSPYYNAGSGRVWLLKGAPNGVMTFNDAAVATYDGGYGDGAGFDIAVGPGVLIGSPHSNTVTLLDLNLAPLGRIQGTSQFGANVDWLDDFNGDGSADAIIFAPEESGDQQYQGSATLVSGQRLMDGTLAEYSPEPINLDNDGDGSTTMFDCDDYDADRSPGFEETCNDGIDNNCNGQVDEEVCSSCSYSKPPTAGWLILSPLLLLRRRDSQVPR
jgi:hypothetical protein